MVVDILSKRFQESTRPVASSRFCTAVIFSRVTMRNSCATIRYPTRWPAATRFSIAAKSRTSWLTCVCWSIPTMTRHCCALSTCHDAKSVRPASAILLTTPAPRNRSLDIAIRELGMLESLNRRARIRIQEFIELITELRYLVDREDAMSLCAGRC